MKFHSKSVSRRQVLKRAASAALMAGVPPAIIPTRANAQKKTLKILRWKHFVPGYDRWFNEEFIKTWGDNNDTEVIVDNVALGELNGLATNEATANSGHDLVLHLAPPALFEDHVIDHREIYEECVHQYGKAIAFTRRGSYNPKTRNVYGICESYAPTVVTYRNDLWAAAGLVPNTWEDVRKGGRIIKLLHENPVGLSLAPEHNAKHTVRAILYAFGGSVQDADGNPALKSPQTLEAIKYCKALYQDTMTSEVLGWDASSNNRFVLSEEGSMTIDTLSIPRAAESKSLPVDTKLSLTQLPEGPAGRIGPNFGAYTYTIWKFAENIQGAKKFLVDYVGHSSSALTASGFQNMPAFPGSVDNFDEILSQDSERPERYEVLKNVVSTMTNLGHPGHSNAATNEILNQGIVAKMFAEAASGVTSPEQSLDDADRAIRPVFEKWRAAGKI